MEEKLRNVFEDSFRIFLERECENICSGVSERNLCARLACILEIESHKSGFPENYVADVEYNRMQGGNIKTIINGNPETIKITCDLILHSRGKQGENDNLIAIEMKKKGRREEESESDRKRLIAITRKSFDEIWALDELSLEHVCGYKLGYFIEIDNISRNCKITEFINGEEKEPVI
ncbi:hypothetical protein [Erwinia pyrifoliae]|nr:hypothetical protein [Erwinia pyrifoliae]AUX71445.1 hypothetical protein CPI84_02355 [Erwinia pyrifoliae]MCA8874825.1 hypothetical protein [Erwinia pyrifoliae]UWS28941.1 hypothetical protein NYP81_13530 [Erwinia pyrifoliae]UXK11912.1 hypothetical protein NYP80_16740 [Erwinia pyrifoliae]CAX56983.1 uncharacterized protein EpC_32040 [Erwinia pyrifoliae Ep1/96]